MAGVDAPAGRREAQLQQLRKHEPGVPPAGQPRELVLDAPAHVGVLGAHGAAARLSAWLSADPSAAVYSERGREGGLEERGGVARTRRNARQVLAEIRRSSVQSARDSDPAMSQLQLLACLQTFEVCDEALCLIKPCWWGFPT